MRFYTYRCLDCDISQHLELEATYPGLPPRHAICPVCQSLVEQDYVQKGVQVDAFRAYTERDFGAVPVEVTSKRHREELCKKTRSTYDTGRYVSSSKKRTPWEKDLTWEKVKAKAAENAALDRETGQVDVCGSSSEVLS